MPGDLATAARLRRRWPAELVAAATLQAELRVKAAAKFDRAEQMLFTRAGLEQASAQVVSAHRTARLPAGARVADLCCGIGGDTAALRAALAVDRDPLHARLARHNARVHGADPQVVVADVGTVDVTAYDVVFIDPARRDARGRGGYRPPLEWCLQVGTVVKAAPGLDRALVPRGWEAELVSVGRELKEATLWAPPLASAPARATLLPEGHTLVADPGAAVPVAEPGEWLVDPDPAVTRAGLVQTLARRLDGWLLDPRIAFVSTSARPRTPFGRVLRVEQSLPWHERELAAALRRADVGAVDIRRRGLAGDVDEVRRRLRLRGSRRVMLVMTRLRGRPWALVCTQPGAEPN